MFSLILFLQVITQTLHIDNYTPLFHASELRAAAIPCDKSSPYVIQPIVITHDNIVPPSEGEIEKIIGETIAIYFDSSDNRYIKVEPRFAMTKDCTLNIVSIKSEDIISYTVTSGAAEILFKQFHDPYIKYLIFDNQNLSGSGWSIITDNDKPEPAAHLQSGLSVIIQLTGETVAHELTHMLGAVQLSSPHSTGHYHSYDTVDIMSYVDSYDTYLADSCNGAILLDCNHDDYFSLNKGNVYLDTHWNIANSPYLIRISNLLYLPFIVN